MSENTKQEASRALVWLARIGYCTRGVVYIVVGALALLAAFGEGGKTTGTKGALQTVMSSPFGEVLIAVIALGLFGYALWRVVQSLADADNQGTDAKGIAIRGGLLVSAVSHLLLGIYAASMLFGGSGSSSSSGSSDFAATLMGQPWGRILVFIVALCILGVAVAHLIKAFGEKYKKYFAMDRSLMEKVDPVIKFGLASRAVVFTLIAFFMGYAAYAYDPQKAGGLNAALDFIQRQAYGPILLGIIALGLFAFGIYSFLEGIYRRINPR